jgi:hypothetical protein
MLDSEKEILFSRDEKGELIPEKVTLETGKDIYIVPLTRGESKRIFLLEPEEQEKYILMNCVKIPKFSESDLEFAKPEFIDALIKEVLTISGFEMKKSKRTLVDEDEWAKKNTKIRNERKEGDMFLFLHEQGYTYYNIGKLTFKELNVLIDAWNRKVELENQSMSKGKK